ncbi:amidohydrolase family protein [Microbacterium betulae]|uniref:Amidohydrolase family protein n=1 Tax=Microbacterium betulae TaxID=2981139 RepID=A0AA97FGQ4_9MICO|nr:amidohydrolase family protein [Microbacterium sp. AB]WOF22868.1 amidohydrolase family protein [Microbacterium sp. AB]
MIVDVHGHVSAPSELYAWKAGLLAHRGSHGVRPPRISDDQLREAYTAPNASFGDVSHFHHLDTAGVDVQLISPRPYQMMHSEGPARIVEAFTEEVNNVIHRDTELFPGRFRGVAGLPQTMDLTVEQWVPELRRTVTELGFVGALLNPDPYEGTRVPPALGDRFWYPLYEALVELDVPAIVHAAGCRAPAREPYSLHFIQEETVAIWSLLSSDVLKDFPDLKLIITHGGGAIPYQAGRFLPSGVRSGATPYLDRLRTLRFDTCLYTRDAIELLLKTVGVDRCLFGTEKPGTGSQIDPATGRWFDDIHLLVDEIEWLTDDQRESLLHGNAESIFAL